MNRDKIVEDMARACEGVRGWDTPMEDYARAALNASGLLERVEELEAFIKNLSKQENWDTTGEHWIWKLEPIPSLAIAALTNNTRAE